MSEELEKSERRPGVERRTLVKGAAWSLPVIAVAVGTPLASASQPFDLVPAFSSSLSLSVKVLTVTLAEVNLFGSLTITNNGTAASPANATVLLTYNSALVQLTISGVGVTVAGTAGNRLLTLPSIPAGGTLTIDLSPSLLSSGILALGVGAHASTITAVVTAAGDTVNNTATGSIGITVLRLS
ncbi:hypothetical protein [Subtercola sp. YIM 133946]|uniref:hypothetical protein n=1 Tax=Subtercola sp. YIM 133946 TaxID=3118909 RepID=UPI002F93FBDD